MKYFCFQYIEWYGSYPWIPCKFPTNYTIGWKAYRGRIFQSEVIKISVKDDLLGPKTLAMKKLYFYQENDETPVTEFFTGLQFLKNKDGKLCFPGESEPPFVNSSFGGSSYHRSSFFIDSISYDDFKEEIAEFLPYRDIVADEVQRFIKYIVRSFHQYEKYYNKIEKAEEREREKARREVELKNQRRRNASDIINDIIRSRK